MRASSSFSRRWLGLLPGMAVATPSIALQYCSYRVALVPRQFIVGLSKVRVHAVVELLPKPFDFGGVEVLIGRERDYHEGPAINAEKAFVIRPSAKGRYRKSRSYEHENSAG